MFLFKNDFHIETRTRSKKGAHFSCQTFKRYGDGVLNNDDQLSQA